MNSLSDKVVFITGASSGIGKACAVEFAKFGAKVIITARRGEKIEQLSQYLQDEYQAQVLAIELDV